MQRKIVLASQSFRRKQLLEQIGITDFEIRESAYEEDMTLNKKPVELAEFLAYEKAKEVAQHYEDAIIIAGDTMIFMDDKVYGKAKSLEEAKKMLLTFSGQKIGCVSGLAMIDAKSKKEIITHGIGWLKFRDLSEEEIVDYLQTENDILKVAGAFNILSKGAILMEKTEGDFFSIVGLPINKVYLGLKGFGVNVLKN